MQENYDDLIADIEQSNAQTAKTTKTAQTAAKQQNPELSKEEFAAKMKAEREKLSALIESTAKSIGENSTVFQNYLDTLSRFELYSTYNTLLIFAQKPDATRIAGYGIWDYTDTKITKGEKAISIYEPGKEYTREDGTTGISMNIKKVFDISQTSAKDLEVPAVKHEIRTLLKALINSSPVPVKLVDAVEIGSGAQFNEQLNVIEVARGLDGDSLFRALTQEVAFATLYKQSPDEMPIEDVGFAAYATSYVICKKSGVDTKDYNFSESPEYFKEKDSKEIIGEIKAIRDSTHEIAGRMHKELTPPVKDAKSQDAR